jgi:NADPH2:quinone reductase
MKAVLCKAFGPPESLVVEEVPDLEAGSGQVVVDVAACGVNFPDVLIIQDLYQFKPPLPFSPGGEVSGTVRAVGPDVTDVAVGDRVVAMTMAGGMAEQVVVPATSVVRLPEGDLDMSEAAGLLFAYGTSYYALKDRAALQPGETLLVLGAAGGVGLAAVELGAAMGARVIAAASTDDKLGVCRERGAAETVNYATEDLKGRIKQLTGGLGVDVCYDPVGGDYAEAALRSMAWEGRFLVIGFAAGDIPRIPLNLVLLKGCQVVGVFWGSAIARDPAAHQANVAELMAMWHKGSIRPYISETYPLERAGEAINRLATRQAKGKIVVTVG